ncbi:MAG: type I restriction enzyme HsdR N-terminal domain-containing protein [Chitinophagales bacterium]
MTEVRFSQYPFRFREVDQQKQIFDIVRKRFVALTPEEWVRQHVLHFLVEKGFNAALLAVEKQIEVNGRQRRFDVVAYNRQAQPLILVECKAPQIPITDAVLMQAVAYNQEVDARYFWLTNGEQHALLDRQTGLWLNGEPTWPQP